MEEIMSKNNVVMGLLVVGLVLTAVNISLKMRDQMGTQTAAHQDSPYNTNNLIKQKSNSLSRQFDVRAYNSLDVYD